MDKEIKDESNKSIETSKGTDSTIETKSETTQEDSAEKFYNIQLEDGESWPVNAKDFIMLATIGANELKRKKTENNKNIVSQTQDDDESNITEDDRIGNLEKELKQLRNEKIAETEYQKISGEFKSSTEKSERLKSNEKLANAVNAVALAQYQHNPRVSLSVHHANTLKVIEGEIEKEVEKEKNKLKGTRMINNVMNSSIRGGSTSTLETGKKFSPDDVKKGASRRSMEEILNKLI